MKPCIFCSIDKSNILLENETCIAFYDGYPVTKGHALVISKEHITNYFKASSQLKNEMWQTVDDVKAFLDTEFKPDGYNIGINVNEAAGQTVFHCHIHVIPRYFGDMSNPKGGVRGVIPNKQKY